LKNEWEIEFSKSLKGGHKGTTGSSPLVAIL